MEKIIACATAAMLAPMPAWAPGGRLLFVAAAVVEAVALVGAEVAGVDGLLVVVEVAGIVDVLELEDVLLVVDWSITVFVKALGGKAWNVSSVGALQCGPASVAPQQAHSCVVELYTMFVWRPEPPESTFVQYGVQTVVFE